LTTTLTCLPIYDRPLPNGVRGESGVAPINSQVSGAEAVAVALTEAAGMVATVVN
jgi:hypothetical protein